MPLIQDAYRKGLVDEEVIDWPTVSSTFNEQNALPEEIEISRANGAVGSYFGDAWMERSLMILGSHFRTDDLKFFVLGSILRVEMVSPSKLLDTVLVDFDGQPVEFQAEGQMRNFMQNFMALWNDMASYQDQLFELPLIKGDDSRDEGAGSSATFLLVRHNIWMAAFLDGLGVEDEDGGASASNGQPLLEAIFNYRKACDNLSLEDSDAAKIELVEALRKGWASHYLSFAKSLRDLRLKIITKKKFVEDNRHVGRNDPCPCGSSKKFKKCCLTESRLRLM